MITQKQTQPLPKTDLLIPHIHGCQTVFLDIETTGFHRQYAQVMLIGVMTVDTTTCHLIQWFSESTQDEPALLSALSDFLLRPSHIITFNGNRFDRPFLEARYWAHHMPSPFEGHYFTDLLDWAKTLPDKCLPNRKLKTIENYLGINRTDTISGKESITLYKEYLSRPNKELLKKILLHNADDIINMYPLWQLHRDLDAKVKPHLVPVRINDHVLTTLSYDGCSLSLKGLQSMVSVKYQNYTGHILSLHGARFSLKLITLPLPPPHDGHVVIDYRLFDSNIKSKLSPKTCLIIENGAYNLKNLSHVLDLIFSFYQ